MKRLVQILIAVAVAMGGFLAIQHFSAGDGKTIQGKNFSYDDETATVYLKSGWIEGVDYSGHDAILKCPTGDIVIPNGNGKILSVVDSSGIRSTYKVEFGIKTVDLYTYNNNETNLILGASYGKNGEKGVGLKSKTVLQSCDNINASMVTSRMELTGNEKDNILIAGSGGSKLSGGSGGDRDQLYGGAGEDAFIWSGSIFGDDTIFNYTKGQDTIEITIGPIDSYKISGNDVILRIGETALTVKDVKPEDINLRYGYVGKADNNWIQGLKDTDGITFTSDKIIIDRKFKRNFYLIDHENSSANIDATTLERSIFIEGDNRDNVIQAGKGGISVDGLGGDDTFYLSPRQDVIYFGAYSGSDTVYGYGKWDMIKLRNQEDMLDGYYMNGTDLVLKCGDAKLTLKDTKPEFVIVEHMGGAKENSWREKRLS